ncbi:hypothetical protein GCM10022226_27720 [Sphaerisporangium flaviroseum]|uniref:Uncharacterized protein n=1 Tax=Sphaerisporangium flaviroseum TaxID=509199 RepID=A0ABP7I4K8_9ACTN
MEPYRRDPVDEPVRDPETGHVFNPTGDHDRDRDRRLDEADTVYDEADHDRDKRDLDGSDDLDATPDPAHSSDPIQGSHGSDLDGSSDPVHGSDHDGSSDPVQGSDHLGSSETDASHGRDGLSESDGLDGKNDDHDRNDVLGKRNDLADPDNDLGEPAWGADDVKKSEQAKNDDQADLIVYPEDAERPTQSVEDSKPASGVPGLEPLPAAGAQHTNDNDVHRDESGTAVIAGSATDTAAATSTATATDTGAATGTASDTAGESIDFQQRWREVQAGFVDDPRDAVERADQLVEEAVTALTTRRQGLVDRWKNSDQSDTEQLRLALRDYRSLLQDLVGLSYSTAGQGSSPARKETR